MCLILFYQNLVKSLSNLYQEFNSTTDPMVYSTIQFCQIWQNDLFQGKLDQLSMKSMSIEMTGGKPGESGMD